MLPSFMIPLCCHTWLRIGISAPRHVRGEGFEFVRGAEAAERPGASIALIIMATTMSFTATYAVTVSPVTLRTPTIRVVFLPPVVILVPHVILVFYVTPIDDVPVPVLH